MIARACLYGLAGAGRRGVDAVIEMFRRDLITAMQFTGSRSRHEIGAQLIARAPRPPQFSTDG